MVFEKFIIAGGFATRIKCYGFDKDVPSGGDGDGKPVLMLLHGYLEALDVWEDFVPLLPEFRVVTMDTPGHGISQVKGDIHTMKMMADVAAGVLDYLGIGKVYLAGHSMGGYVAAEFLARHADRLRGIIMFHSTPNADSQEKKADRQRQIDLVDSGKKDLLAMTVEKGFAADNLTRFADCIEDLREQVVLTEEDGVKAILRGMMQREDNNEVFIKSPVPQLFIHGRKDEHISSEAAAALEERHPQAVFRYLDNSGHMGFVEQPEESAGIIKEFAGIK